MKWSNNKKEKCQICSNSVQCQRGKSAIRKRDARILQVRVRNNFWRLSLKNITYQFYIFVFWFDWSVSNPPKFLSLIYISTHFSDHNCQKNIVVPIFVNFLWIFQVRRISPFCGHDRAMTKNDQQCSPSKKNVWEHAIVWFKIVAECKEDVFSEGFPVQHA